MNYIGVHTWISAFTPPRSSMVVGKEKKEATKDAPKKSPKSPTDSGVKKASNELKIFKTRLVQ
jgi:hypothetical protein